MKKTIVPILGAVALTMQSCFLASLVTSTPTVVVQETTPTVVVSQPAVQTVVTQHNTTTYVTAPSTVNTAMYLDLNAVAAAFAQCSSVRLFEQMLNSPAYMINNLDLNRDGYIDYLRVLEQPTRSGVHTFLIQACVAANTYTDVATITSNGRDYVRVTGATPIYGANCYVQPTYVRTPAIYPALCQTNYVVWTSPYGYNNYPSYYSRPQCYELSHYQAYCKTYVDNNKYLHADKGATGSTVNRQNTTTTTATREPITNKTGDGGVVTQRVTKTQETATPAKQTTGHGVSSSSNISTNAQLKRTTSDTNSRTTVTNVHNNGSVNTRISTVMQHSDGTQTVQTTRTTATSHGSTTTTRSTSTAVSASSSTKTSGHGQR